MFKIGFDHCYQFIDSPDQYFQLRKRGFEIDESLMVEHPGTKQCRFITLNSSDHVTPGRDKQYLEFIFARDKNAHRDYSLSQGMLADDFSRNVPGLSLTLDHGLKSFYGLKKDNFIQHEISFDHRNYLWKENTNDRLPGWNFINFKKSVVPETYIWLTEYEKNPNSKEKPTTSSGIKHPNTCSEIKGCLWGANLEQVSQFENLTERKFQKNLLTLDDGSKIWLVDMLSSLGKEFRDRKKYLFWAVVVECTNFEKFKTDAKPEKIFEFDEKPAALLRLGNNGWDILVVGSSS